MPNSETHLQKGLIYYKRASAIFDKANLRYSNFEKPTHLDYLNYRQEILKSAPEYQTCILCLKKSSEMASNEYVKNAIAIANNRLIQMELKKIILDMFLNT